MSGGLQDDIVIEVYDADTLYCPVMILMHAISTKDAEVQ
jgi:hypothetical protein